MRVLIWLKSASSDWFGSIVSRYVIRPLFNHLLFRVLISWWVQLSLAMPDFSGFSFAVWDVIVLLFRLAVTSSLYYYYYLCIRRIKLNASNCNLHDTLSIYSPLFFFFFFLLVFIDFANLDWRLVLYLLDYFLIATFMIFSNYAFHLFDFVCQSFLLVIKVD